MKISHTTKNTQPQSFPSNPPNPYQNKNIWSSINQQNTLTSEEKPLTNKQKGITPPTPKIHNREQ